MSEFFLFFFSFTRSIGKKPFKVDIVSERPVRVWKEILDRNDGSYLVRMRFYETLETLEISVKYKGTHVGKSPFKLKGNKLLFTGKFYLL